MIKKERVLVVGGGFAGVKSALELADDERFDITLLSDQEEMRYYPTLYRTATGGQRANSSIPLSEIFKNKDVKLETGVVATSIDRKAKTIFTAAGQIFEYDTLVLALGVVTNYFNIPGLQEFSYSIKTQEEAARFKAHLHQQLEDDHRPDLSYVIVGGGPTGIELAGALPAYLLQIMKNHNVEPRSLHIDLVEGAPRLLQRLPSSTSRSVTRQLKKLGVQVYVGKRLEGQTAEQLTVSGKPIRSHTVVWTAGVTNHPFFSENKFSITSHGKVSVDVYLQTEDNIFVLGDNANTPYSGMAQTALYDGIFLARNLRRRASGKNFKSYKAKKPVTVIPCGPLWAAVLWGPLSFNGLLGWLLRESADFKGFQDLEPWPHAAKQWFSEFASEDNCEICAISSSRHQ